MQVVFSIREGNYCWAMDYRSFLTQVFEKKVRQNPRYSLRAFARDSGMSPSRLSEVFSGKGQLSKKSALRVVDKLKLTQNDRSLFLDLVVSEIATDPMQRMVASKRAETKVLSRKKSLLDLKSFELVADPKFIAVWSFMSLRSFDGTIESLVKAFNFNAIEIYSLLTKLKSAGLVLQKGSEWRAVEGSFNVGDSVPSEAGCSYHKQLSTLGRQSVDAVSFKERHLDSVVMPVRSSNFSTIQSEIVAFCEHLLVKHRDPTGDSVYALSLQFFPMTQRLI
jgi:uncharacterized protein (TIGR02147 family)